MARKRGGQIPLFGAPCVVWAAAQLHERNGGAAREIRVLAVLDPGDARWPIAGERFALIE